ncbi:hypothetical protein AXF42_Ash016783 [Apostasia shenzhenica]|uniref:Uncharacterized protein n=1 Tax=Apostasia shenzhenica TaxID=1088818 RepID=A0A2I0BAC7_9ASPA|nr:hypothetical protein AXF42_Ash016783 [Apostasia shenzhenica]
MGSCVSKCCLKPSCPIHPNPQDKLVISQSNITSVTNPSSSIFSSSDSITNSYPSSSSSSSSSSKTTPCSHESSLSSLPENKHIVKFQENKHIVVLDPHKDGNAMPTSPNLLGAKLSPNQKNFVKISRSLPTKRERSCSPPSFSRQKSIKVESKPVTAAPLWRAPLSPTRMIKIIPPSHSMKDQRIIIDRFQQRKTRPSRPYNASRRLVRKGDAVRSAHLVPQGQGQWRRMEDIDNPLISMECFIFL